MLRNQKTADHFLAINLLLLRKLKRGQLSSRQAKNHFSGFESKLKHSITPRPILTLMSLKHHEYNLTFSPLCNPIFQ